MAACIRLAGLVQCCCLRVASGYRKKLPASIAAHVQLFQSWFFNAYLSLAGSPAERLLAPIANYIKAKGGRIHTRWGCRWGALLWC